MAIDKVLLKIQSQITDLVQHLEEFVQPNVQPGSKECDLLKNQLTQLQDLLTIYTHLKQEKEISPSFNIHAKVSKTNEPTSNTELNEDSLQNKAPETSKNEEIIKENTENIITKVDTPLKTSISTKVNIGLNDKFRFINELFNQNTNEYNIAIEQFNAINNSVDFESFFNSLCSLYNWNTNNATVKHFLKLLQTKYK